MLFVETPRRPSDGRLFGVEELQHLSANDVAAVTEREARAYRAARDNAVAHTTQVVEVLDKSIKKNIKSAVRKELVESLRNYMLNYPSQSILRRHVIPRVTVMVKTSSKYKNRKDRILTAWQDLVGQYERAVL